MRAAGLAIAICVLLAGCSDGSANLPENTFNVDETLTTENVVANDVTAVDSTPASTTRPSHHYNFREGDLYGYIAAISEEERKQGKAAGDVVMFRYKGYWDSVDHLEYVAANGRVISYDECGRPCVAIKSTYNNRVERIAFNPTSLVGAAFQDAANGYLEASQPKPKPAQPDLYAGDNSPQEYREPVAGEANANQTVPAE